MCKSVKIEDMGLNKWVKSTLGRCLLGVRLQLSIVFCFGLGMDEAALWWASVVSVAVHWLMGDDENAERCYSMVDTFPKKFQSLE